MSKVNDVQAGMWGEEDFLSLSPNAKLVYLWSFTNSLCGMAGLYRVALRVIAFETNLDNEATNEALNELAEGRFAYYEDGAIFVRSRVRHLRTKTEQVAKSIRSDVARLQMDHPLKAHFMREYGSNTAWGKGVLHAILSEGSPDAQVSLTPTPPEGHVSDKGKGKGKEKEGGSGETSRDVALVFAAWIDAKSVHAGRRCPAVLDAKRRRIIAAAIKSHGVDGALAAVQGWLQSPYHRGENETGKAYNDLGLLLRDADHIEGFRDLHLKVAGHATAAPVQETKEQLRARMVREARDRNDRLMRRSEATA